MARWGSDEIYEALSLSLFRVRDDGGERSCGGLRPGLRTLLVRALLGVAISKLRALAPGMPAMMPLSSKVPGRVRFAASSPKKIYVSVQLHFVGNGGGSSRTAVKTRRVLSQFCGGAVAAAGAGNNVSARHSAELRAASAAPACCRRRGVAQGGWGGRGGARSGGKHAGVCHTVGVVAYASRPAQKGRLACVTPWGRSAPHGGDALPALYLECVPPAGLRGTQPPCLPCQP